MEDRVRELETELARHETQCEERWKTTFSRLEEIDDKIDRIESRIVGGGAILIMFLAGLIVTILYGQ
ncbi:MAG: hypothetical protein ACO4AC_10785 [Pseudohongiellaceae bacterium]|jgi:hypothetical protein